MYVRGILLAPPYGKISPWTTTKISQPLGRTTRKRGANSWNGSLRTKHVCSIWKAFVGAMDLCVRNAVSLENLTGPVEVGSCAAPAGIRVRSRLHGVLSCFDRI